MTDNPVASQYKMTRACGAVGPYCVRSPTPARPNRLVVLSCTRPPHDDGRHLAADPDGVVVAAWGATGAPINPLPIDRRSNHGPTDPV